MTTHSILCQLNGGCMGCCGHDFVSKEKIEETIELNTKEFTEDLIAFRDRALSSDLRNGVCRNLIKKEGKIFCPLHPAVNGDKDLRENHCNTHYLCKTAKEFAEWDEMKQQKFISFIGDENLDSISYSIKMDNGKLLEEFTENLK